MSINDNIKFSEKIKQGFKRTIFWTNIDLKQQHKQKNNNLDYLIDVAFRKINRLFVLSFKNGNDDPTRNSFDALTDNKPFFDQPVKINKKRTTNLVKCQYIMTIQQEIY